MQKTQAKQLKTRRLSKIIFNKKENSKKILNILLTIKILNLINLLKKNNLKLVFKNKKRTN